MRKKSLLLILILSSIGIVVYTQMQEIKNTPGLDILHFQNFDQLFDHGDNNWGRQKTIALYPIVIFDHPLAFENFNLPLSRVPFEIVGRCYLIIVKILFGLGNRHMISQKDFRYAMQAECSFNEFLIPLQALPYWFKSPFITFFRNHPSTAACGIITNQVKLPTFSIKRY